RGGVDDRDSETSHLEWSPDARLTPLGRGSGPAGRGPSRRVSDPRVPQPRPAKASVSSCSGIPARTPSPIRRYQQETAPIAIPRIDPESPPHAALSRHRCRTYHSRRGSYHRPNHSPSTEPTGEGGMRNRRGARRNEDLVIQAFLPVL